MSSRSLYRRHSPQFKLQLCTDIRNGKIGRREARRTDEISADRIQLWLSQYDGGELSAEEAAATTISDYEAKIAA
jgi:transposase